MHRIVSATAKRNESEEHVYDGFVQNTTVEYLAQNRQLFPLTEIGTV